jgi:large subunit ribosomal protein L21
MAYAIFKTGGKQYKVKPGDKLDVEKLALEVGAETSFSEVLYVNDGETALIGNPLVEGALVHAKVVDQHRAPKVTAFKYRRRKGSHKTKGHRLVDAQQGTLLLPECPVLNRIHVDRLINTSMQSDFGLFIA